jgi:Flp pilus assembly protein TadG
MSGENKTQTEDRKGEVPSRRWCDSLRLKGLGKDENGNLPIIFAFMVPIIFGVVGGATDVGRFVSAKNQTLAALDSAVLAAGRSMQINGATEADAQVAASTYYNQNRYKHFNVDQTAFTLEDAGSSIVGSTAATISTPFLAVLGFNELSVNLRAKALLQANGNAGTDIEISLMLDTTGSMGWASSSGGTKMEALKLAAKDLIDIIIWDNQTTRTAKMALAPFSEHVNVGRDYFQTVTGQSPSGNGNDRTCVRERQNDSLKYDRRWPNNSRKFEPYTGGSRCRTSNVIVPLTYDKVKLKAAIDNLETTGGTAGHLGTAWAWYLLDPSWGGGNRVWGAESDAQGYGLINQTRTVTVGDATYEVQKLRKIAVLMTDGEYNRQYNGTDSATQAKELCTGMKNRGIEIYSVGFEISNSGNAYDVMSHCATSPDHFYNATDGDALRLAFRDIGLKVSTLRLAE